MEHIILTVTDTPTLLVCEDCGGKTRLVGLEPHLTDPTADVLTHACMLCDAMQVTVRRRRERA